ncbi:MAG: winged helix-turn-helix domain-containing protein [Pseudomonadota bacterium]
MKKRLTVGDLVVDLAARTVARGERALDVSGRTFDLLAALIRADGAFLRHEELAKAAWPRADEVTNEAIAQRVRLLRRALGDDAANPQYIENRRHDGYRVCARMIELAADDGASVMRRGTAHWLAVLGLAALFVAGLAMKVSAPPIADPILERARAYALTGEEADNRRAIELFEQKLGDSPENAAARLGLSLAASRRACRFDDDPAWATRARSLAASLLEESPRDARAQFALASSDDCLGRIDDALSGYQRAIEFDPSKIGPRASAAYLLQVRGRLHDALAAENALADLASERVRAAHDLQITRCLELLGFVRSAEARLAARVRLDPVEPHAVAAYARFLMSHRNMARASAVIVAAREQGAISAELTSVQAEVAWRQSGRAAALAFARESAELAHRGTWALTLANLIDPQQADRAAMRVRIDQLRNRIGAGDQRPELQLEIAALHFGLDELDRAHGALDASITQGFRDAAYLEASPVFQPLVSSDVGREILQRARDAAKRERTKVLAASWWSPSLIEVNAL